MNVWSSLVLISVHVPMNVHVHVSLAVERSLALLEIPQVARSEVVYLQSTVPSRGSILDPKCRAHTAVQPGCFPLPFSQSCTTWLDPAQPVLDEESPHPTLLHTDNTPWYFFYWRGLNFGDLLCSWIRTNPSFSAVPYNSKLMRPNVIHKSIRKD